MDCSPPGSSVHGILQARVLEWVAIPFSRGFSQPRDRTQVSTLQADSLPSEPRGKLIYTYIHTYNQFLALYIITWVSLGDSDGKESDYNAGDPGLGRSPGEGNSNPLQCSEEPGALQSMESQVGHD